jgi:DNA-binding GntR family transcriptional regulator
MKSMPNRDTLASQVHESLRSAIILGELVPGSLYSVADLAEKMNVSRTPAREALLKLADAGMVKFERNRGIRILETTIHDLEEIFSLRLLLEVPATYRATQKARPTELRALKRTLEAFKSLAEADDRRGDHLHCDAQFHHIILQASGNSRLARFVDTLRDLQMVRGASTSGKTRTLTDIYDDHERIYERVAARDAAGAARLMRDHIALTGRLPGPAGAGDTAHPERFELPWLDIVGLFEPFRGDEELTKSAGS